MNLEASMAKAIERGGLVVFGLAGVLFALGVQAEAIGGFVVESSKAAGLDQCVEPTEYMRRNHMELIRHQRDTTVYGGIRSTKHSLEGCVTCHTGHREDQTPVPINADGQFCAACHNYAAVTLNCFDCHATIPTGESWNQAPAAGHGQQGNQDLGQLPAQVPGDQIQGPHQIGTKAGSAFALVAAHDYVAADAVHEPVGARSEPVIERAEGEPR
jgi:hypothetical protein